MFLRWPNKTDEGCWNYIACWQTRANVCCAFRIIRAPSAVYVFACPVSRCADTNTQFCYRSVSVKRRKRSSYSYRNIMQSSRIFQIENYWRTRKNDKFDGAITDKTKYRRKSILNWSRTKCLFGSDHKKVVYSSTGKTLIININVS